MSNLPVVRDDKGRFIPGQSGNPEGKAKGLKNYITHERLMLESALRDYVGQPEQAQKLLDGISRVLDIAIIGDDIDAFSYPDASLTVDVTTEGMQDTLGNFVCWHFSVDAAAAASQGMPGS